MKDKVFMSPNNAALLIARPLFQFEGNADALGYSTDKDYAIVLINSKPQAYILYGPNFSYISDAQVCEEMLIDMGDL